MSELPGTRPLGRSFYGLEEPAGEPCEVCGERPGRPQQCPGDRAYHRHGRVHTLDDGLLWVCELCLPAIAEAWERRR
jgi:hypothetical protein